MKILYYDCYSGISGDMNLGAMIDLGIEKSYLVNELNKLNISGWELITEKDQRHGIKGTKVTVRLTQHEHVHRHLSDIESIINNSSLSDDVKTLSNNIFMKVALAEATVHGVTVEEVHFHEVGAIDSIIDIVGAAICFRKLDVGAVYVSEIELGGGLVKCDHGILPVPAPATAEIVKGMPVRKGGVNFEATTPTGAAIVAALGTNFGQVVPFRIEKTGYGVGQKDDPDVPNLLRVYLGQTEENFHSGHKALLLECNIDDMNPEFYDHITERLFSSGASDVFYTNIIMKKGRPGIILSVICEPELAEALKEIIFTESTTLGIRAIRFLKNTLAREFTTISTIYGEVMCKRSSYKGREVSYKPEYDECRRIALEKDLPLKEVYNNIMSVLEKNKTGRK